MVIELNNKVTGDKTYSPSETQVLPLPPGPWMDEIDHATFEAHGFTCMVTRNLLGAWLGYVLIPKEHPLFDLDYVDEVVRDLNVHGGVTFAGYIAVGSMESQWAIGFDCAHVFDVVPGMLAHYGRQTMDTYRTLEYVVAETDGLAAQISEVKR